MSVSRANTSVVLSESVRLSEFAQLLASNRVAADVQTANTARFRQLPADLQERVLAAGGSPVAVAKIGGVRYLEEVRPVRINLALLKPNIITIWPSAGGTPGDWAFAQGPLLADGTQMSVDGAMVDSFWLNFPWMMPPCVALKLPVAGIVRGSTHQVAAHKGAAVGDNFAYKLVAPRGYRGYYGWQFANFGDPNIPPIWAPS